MALVNDVQRMTRNQIRDKYEKLARWYDAQDAIYEFLCVGRLRSHLLAQSTGNILEIAVGTGKNLPFYPANLKVTGIDYSPSMLQKATEKAKELHLPVQLQIMDAEKLDFPDESFGTVVSTLSGCTFPNTEKVYREMARVCRPEGKILLIEHGRSSVSWIGKLQDKLAQAYYNQYACVWNLDPFKPIRSAGLEIVKSETVFFGIFHALELRKSGARKS